MTRSNILLTLSIALMSLSGCSSHAPTPSELGTEKYEGVSPITIFAPHKFNIDGNTFVYYDYYLDCEEDKCKVGKMKYGQYITIYAPYGFHSIFVKTSGDGFANALLVAGRNDEVEQHINVQPNKNHFISHSWSQSFGRHLIGMLATCPSTICDMNEEDGKQELKTLLEKHDSFGGKLNGYGIAGINYQVPQQ